MRTPTQMKAHRQGRAPEGQSFSCDSLSNEYQGISFVDNLFDRTIKRQKYLTD